MTLILLLYIPIWFYFNNCIGCSQYFPYSLYIPIWFYFNQHMLHDLVPEGTLYIPIWFYFNACCIREVGESPDFTFQYGSTLIPNPFDNRYLAADFTFQYGSTLMKPQTPKFYATYLSLHSNMVLL